VAPASVDRRVAFIFARGTTSPFLFALDVPRHRYRQVHAANLSDVTSTAAARWTGGFDNGLLHTVHAPGPVFVLSVKRRMTTAEGRAGKGEPGQDRQGADPVLGRMADAISSTPSRDCPAPGWMLDALGRGLAGVPVRPRKSPAPDR